MPAPCDECSSGVTDALARTVRVSVDRAEVDVQRLCPECFANWIDRYQQEMMPTDRSDSESEIIVD